MPTLGQTLVSERLRQNLHLEQVSTVTRISPRLLKAIELDDFDQLPGRVFARNFVRQYARFLEMNEEPLLAQFDLEKPPLEMVVYTSPEPRNFSRGFSLNLPALADLFGNTTLTSFFSFIGTIVLCGVVLWAFNRWIVVRAHVSPAIPSAVPSKVAASPKIAAAPVVPAASVHVSVEASDSCWTRITADGKVLFTGVLNAGETREVNAASVVDLRAGNAGALVVKLNGSDIPPLGPKGQIRTVILTSSGAHVRTPIPDPVSEPL